MFHFEALRSSVQALRAIELGEGIELDVETLLADLPMDLGVNRAPPFDGRHRPETARDLTNLL